LDYFSARNVARHQVGSELNAFERKIENLSKRADQQRLGQARNTDKKSVAATENGQKNLLDNLILPDNDFSDFRTQALMSATQLLNSSYITDRRRWTDDTHEQKSLLGRNRSAADKNKPKRVCSNYKRYGN
jgi:hypothetical protein